MCYIYQYSQTSDGYIWFSEYAATLHKEYEHFSEDYSDISTVESDVDDVKPNLS